MEHTEMDRDVTCVDTEVHDDVGSRGEEDSCTLTQDEAGYRDIGYQTQINGEQALAAGEGISICNKESFYQENEMLVPRPSTSNLRQYSPPCIEQRAQSITTDRPNVLRRDANRSSEYRIEQRPSSSYNGQFERNLFEYTRPQHIAPSQSKHSTHSLRRDNNQIGSGQLYRNSSLFPQPDNDHTTHGQTNYSPSQHSAGRQNYQYLDGNPRNDGRRDSRYANFRNDHISTNIKVPAFTGKENWQVWFNRFVAIADRHHWNDDQRLDCLLPKLQGDAGEFTFSQLPRWVLSDYKELVRELHCQFKSIDTPRTYMVKFSRRDQYENETAEEYATELKRLYAKAYSHRDNRVKQEDLVRRFLDGLKEDDARFEVEFHKDPQSIESAVYHVVNLEQTRRRATPYGEKKMRKFTRRVQSDDSSDFDEEGYHDNEQNQVQRLRNDDPKLKENTKTRENLTTTSLHGESQSDMSKILQQILDKLSHLTYNKSSAVQTNMSDRTCYACQEKGHISRYCPNKPTHSRSSDPKSNKMKFSPNTENKMTLN